MPPRNVGAGGGRQAGRRMTTATCTDARTWEGVSSSGNSQEVDNGGRMFGRNFAPRKGPQYRIRTNPGAVLVLPCRVAGAALVWPDLGQIWLTRHRSPNKFGRAQAMTKFAPEQSSSCQSWTMSANIWPELVTIGRSCAQARLRSKMLAQLFDNLGSREKSDGGAFQDVWRIICWTILGGA